MLWLWTLLAISGGLSAPSSASTATLRGVDLYRSEQVVREQLEERFGPLIQEYVGLRNSRSATSARRAEALKSHIEALVGEQGRFAFVNLSYVEYFTSAQRSAYITFDVVDVADVKERMPFWPTPAGQTLDPEGLLEAWSRYAELGEALRNRGELPFGRSDCLAYHCIWGSATPELGAFEKRFQQFVPPNKKMLMEVLEKEADPLKRTRAVYLLCYLPSGRDVSIMAGSALKDPDERVRAAGLQVLSDLAVYHKDVQVNVHQIIAALDYPLAGDRSRALGVLVGLVSDPEHKLAILERAARRLPQLLRLEQPSNHDLAYTLLGLLSREAYHRRDYKAWDYWSVTQAPKAAAKLRKSR